MIDTADAKGQYLRRLQIYISRMPSLSTTLTKVLEICNNPNTSPNDLSRVISLDPVLTGQVLKVVNSAYYSLPNKVTSSAQAIILLGLNTVKNLALSTAIMAGLRGRDAFQGFSTDDFWAHSICVGVTAKTLAAIKGISKAEREGYFVAGLLHDLGKIPLNRQLPQDYVHALVKAKKEQVPLHYAEDLIMGFDHCLVGRMIAEKWRLGETLIEALYYHHDTKGAKAQNRDFVSIVALANMYANVFDIGTSGDSFPDEKTLTSLLETLGIEWSMLSEILETVSDDIEKAKVFLEVSRPR